MIRGLDDMPDEEQAKLQPRLPIGFWYPEVIGQLEDGQHAAARLIEYEALRGREEPLSDAQAGQLWGRSRSPAGDPGERGDAGVRVPRDARDHARPAAGAGLRVSLGRRAPGLLRRRPRRIVWALGPTAMFHVYHHCSGEVWGARLLGARRDPRVVRAVRAAGAE